MKLLRGLKRNLALVIPASIIIFMIAGISVTFATLTLSGTGITGDSSTGIDTAGILSIGTSSSTAITIGSSAITTSFPGLITIAATTTTQNLKISGLAASGNPCLTIGATGVVATSTCASAGGITAINGLSNATTSIVGTLNQIIVASSSPNVITLSLPQSIAAASSPTFAGLNISGVATTTNLSVIALASSGNPCLTIGLTGVVATSTCSGSFTAAGDLSGTASSQTVIGLQGISISTSTPTNGQVLTYNSGTTKWTPTTSSGGGTTRTWSYMFAGTTQGGATGFALNLPSATAPTLTNSGGTVPMPVLEWPTGQSTYYAWATFLLPPGYSTNSPISYLFEYRSADSSHAAILTPSIACVGTSGALDNPTFGAGSTVNFTANSSSHQTITSGTWTPNTGSFPTCSTGQRIWIKLLIDTNTNSMTQPFDLGSVTFSVTGSM